METISSCSIPAVLLKATKADLSMWLVGRETLTGHVCRTDTSVRHGSARWLGKRVKMKHSKRWSERLSSAGVDH